MLAQTLRFLHAFLDDPIQPENLRIVQHLQPLDDLGSPGGVAQRQLVVDPLQDFLPLCRHMPAQLGQRLLVLHHHFVPGQLRRRHWRHEIPHAEGIQQHVHRQKNPTEQDEQGDAQDSTRNPGRNGHQNEKQHLARS